MSKNNTITINGKSYDAESGALLSEKSAARHKPVQHAKPAASPVRHAANHAHGHAPEHSKTLARRSVHKPGVKTKSQFKTSLAVEERPEQMASIEVKSSLAQVDKSKLQHAKAVPQSKLISRFATPSASEFTPVFEAPPPLAMPAPISPATTHDKPKTTAALLEKAIEHATSHEQPKHPAHKTRRKGLSRKATVSAAALALIALIAVQNVNSLKVQMASSRAGFTAALPAYRPAGFRLGNVQSGSGVVALNYVSNSDQDRRFTVIEKSTNWDSQALLNNFVMPSNQSYEPLSTNGNIYYVYGEHNVTWVSGGIWYQVQSKDALGDQQLIDLAESL